MMPRLSHGCLFVFKPIGYMKNICSAEEDLKVFLKIYFFLLNLKKNPDYFSLLQKAKFVSSGVSTGMVPCCR